MCASLLRQYGIGEVVYGAGNDKFGGCGGVLSIHVGNGNENGNGTGAATVAATPTAPAPWESRDYRVHAGFLRDEAILLLRRFYVQENERGMCMVFSN